MVGEFLVTSFIVVLVPGTGVIYTVSVGLARGARPSVFAAFGCTVGIVPHLAAAILGLAALLQASILAFQILKLLGAAYLIYLAWRIMQEDGPLRLDREEHGAPLFRTAVTGFLINILNPKLSIFFLAFLPQFVVTRTATPVAQMFALGLIFMLMTFLTFICYGVFAASLRRHVMSRPKIMFWMRRSFALAFVALSVRLAVVTIR